MKVQIVRCSHPGAWWGKYIGRIITVLRVDDYGYWTRDTNEPGAYPFLQWIKPEDTTSTFDGPN